MPVSFTAEAIIFAIHSAIKLNANIRKAFANSLRSRSIVLPLPRFAIEDEKTPDGRLLNDMEKLQRVRRFFKDEGKEHVEKIERLKALFEQDSDQARPPLDKDQKEEYFDYFNLLFYWSEDKETPAGPPPPGRRRRMPPPPKGPDGPPMDIDVNDVVAMLRIRQYEEGEMEEPTALKLVAGSLVEIGIDYFNQVPGALRMDSAFGKAINSFLAGVDNINFTDKEKAGLVVPKLFSAAAESLGALSTAVSRDEKLQQFVQATGEGIAKGVLEQVKKMEDDPLQQEEAVKWGQLMIHSMVQSAGTHVFSSAADLFDTNQPVSDIIQTTGLNLLSAILENPGKIDLKNAFNAEMLNQVVRANLKIVTEHPEMISGKQGAREIIIGVSNAMSQGDVTRPDLLPELVRLIMEHTASNLDLLWNIDQEAAPADKDAHHLLVTTLRLFLEAASQKADDKKWKPAFSKSQLLGIANNLFGEVVRNPNWISNKLGDKPLLKVVLDSVFQSLREIPEDQRFQMKTVEGIIQTSIRAAAANQQILQLADDPTKKTILNKTLDLVFSFAFKSNKVPPATRIDWLTNILDYSLQAVIAHHPDEKGLLLVQLILFDDPDLSFAGGFNRQLADRLLANGLKAINEHPELLSRKEVVQNVFGAVAGSLRDTGLNQPGLLVEITRLVLQNSALQLDKLVVSDNEGANYLLLPAMRQLLVALTAKPENGIWKPALEPEQALGIVEDALDQLVSHPEWLTEKQGQASTFSLIINATFGALQKIPKEERIDARNIHVITQAAIRATATSPQILGPAGPEEGTILNKALDIIFDFTFSPGQFNPAAKEAALRDWLEYSVGAILGRYPDNRGLTFLKLAIEKAAGQSGRIDKEWAAQLMDSAIKVIGEHPALVTQETALQNIISGISTALLQGKPHKENLLPELTRMILHETALNLDLLVKTEQGRPQFLLVNILRQMLEALSNKDENAPWKLKLTEDQILDMVWTTLHETTENPQWLKDDRLVFHFFNAVFLAIDDLKKKGMDLPYSAVEYLIRESLEAANIRRQFLLEIKDEAGNTEKVLALNYSLESLFVTVFDPQHEEELQWALQKTEVINALSRYFLKKLTATELDKPAVDKARLEVENAVKEWKKRTGFVLEDLLEILGTE